MSVNYATINLAERIQRLVAQRAEHAEAIKQIDSTLARVGVALGANGRPHTTAPTHKAAPPTMKAPAPKAKPAAPKAKPAAPKGVRVPQKFAVSGEQSILNFVKTKSNPIGREIEAYWKNEGRKGRAANDLSKLVKLKKLKRTPLKGELGSRYSLA
jgi:hypothetical protein